MWAEVDVVLSEVPRYNAKGKCQIIHAFLSWAKDGGVWSPWSLYPRGNIHC